MIYVVSGMYRSGTTAMMVATEAGGLPVAYSTQRNILNNRHSDKYYKPNPEGLYELADSEISKHGWPREHDGKAIKVVAPLLRHLSVHEYRVVFMLRDSEEIRQSYNAAFRGKLTCEQIEHCQQSSLELLHNRRDVLTITTLQYTDLVADPLSALESIQWPINTILAAQTIQPELYRFRRERLTLGL